MFQKKEGQAEKEPGSRDTLASIFDREEWSQRWHSKYMIPLRTSTVHEGRPRSDWVGWRVSGKFDRTKQDFLRLADIPSRASTAVGTVIDTLSNKTVGVTFQARRAQVMCACMNAASYDTSEVAGRKAVGDSKAGVGGLLGSTAAAVGKLRSLASHASDSVGGMPSAVGEASSYHHVSRETCIHDAKHVSRFDPVAGVLMASAHEGGLGALLALYREVCVIRDVENKLDRLLKSSVASMRPRGEDPAAMRSAASSSSSAAAAAPSVHGATAPVRAGLVFPLVPLNSTGPILDAVRARNSRLPVDRDCVEIVVVCFPLAGL